jgi:hypothetical protein
MIHDRRIFFLLMLLVQSSSSAISTVYSRPLSPTPSAPTLGGDTMPTSTYKHFRSRYLEAAFSSRTSATMPIMLHSSYTPGTLHGTTGIRAFGKPRFSQRNGTLAAKARHLVQTTGVGAAVSVARKRAFAKTLNQPKIAASRSLWKAWKPSSTIVLQRTMLFWNSSMPLPNQRMGRRALKPQTLLLHCLCIKSPLLLKQ